VLFCPPVLSPWSFDYLELAWLRAASLVNVTAPAAGGHAAAERQPLARKPQPLARKLQQADASPPAANNASAQLTPAQRAAVRRYASWSPGSMPWRDANAIYVRLYKSGNDAFKGALQRLRLAHLTPVRSKLQRSRRFSTRKRCNWIIRPR
jgi:hypothetical protein